MKRIITLLSGGLLAAALLAACSSGGSQSAGAASVPAGGTSAASTSAASQAASAASGQLVLTVDELAAYNGKDGQPAYVAVSGVIYDVTDVPAWAGGEHNGLTAGNDLTDEIGQSPHGTGVLADLTVVGRLE